jgi:mRNA interferase MazF
VTFDRFDVHVIEFPFSDIGLSKRRPALIVCNRDFVRQTGNVLFAMITSAKHSVWPGDCEIGDLQSAGLNAPSKVRMRFLTFSAARLDARKGYLAAADAEQVSRALHGTFCG